MLLRLIYLVFCGIPAGLCSSPAPARPKMWMSPVRRVHATWRNLDRHKGEVDVKEGRLDSIPVGRAM
ncbi:hypothetical protein [Dactylosporangium sp. NPDC050588]|uniref:hypothetical protein n=1 Tax=Dactylosporangium sp. NPDC050588 TaxID=3157211 RepID=UPI0033DDF09A